MKVDVEAVIKDLLQKGAKFYGGKDYESAVDTYSEVNQWYEQANGKPNPDYLFLYGRSLYQNALAQSDVLVVGGGEAGGTKGGDAEESEEGEEAEQRGQLSTDCYNRFQFAEEEEEEGAEDEQEEEEENDGDGDGDVEEEEEEEEEREQEDDGKARDADDKAESAEEGEEAATDFEAAWDVLEIARSMYEEALKADTANETLSSKLAETHDLLGEISLELENFQQAAEDFSVCLRLREQLHQKNDSCHRLIIEAHYKVSLALEFDASRIEECKQHLSTSITLLTRLIEEGKGQEDDKELLDELKLKSKELDAPLSSSSAALEQQIHEQLALAAMGGKVNDLTSVVRKRKSHGSSSTKEEKGCDKKPKA